MKSRTAYLVIFLMVITVQSLMAQDPFMLNPNGNTQEFFKYVTKDYNIGGTIYHTGMINLSGYKRITSGTTGVFYNTTAPVQKLQLQGGNILLCRTNSASTTPDINPTSSNGAILFSDMVTSTNNWIHGKWGIEYDNQYSTGGLNFFKPMSQLTSTRINFNLFLSNSGNVGIGSGEPVAKLQVKDGDIFIEDINRGIIMKSPNGSCWRGVLNDLGQLEFVMLPDCSGTLVSSQQIDIKPGILISPNPASGFLRISCTAEDLTKFSSFKIMDASGREVNSFNLDSTPIQVETHNLKPGIYFINFFGKNAYWTEKVMVQ